MHWVLSRHEGRSNLESEKACLKYIIQVFWALVVQCKSTEDGRQIRLTESVDMGSSCFFEGFPNPEFIIKSLNFGRSILSHRPNDWFSIFKADLSEVLSKELINLARDFISIRDLPLWHITQKTANLSDTHTLNSWCLYLREGSLVFHN